MNINPYTFARVLLKNSEFSFFLLRDEDDSDKFSYNVSVYSFDHMLI